MNKKRIHFNFGLPLMIGTIKPCCDSMLIFQEHPMIVLVLRGQIRIERNCCESICKETDMMLLESNAPSKLHASEDSLVFVMVFDINYFQKPFPALPMSIFIEETIHHNERLMVDVLNLALEISNPDSYNDKQLMDACHNLLSGIIDNFLYYSKALQANATNEKQRIEYSMLMCDLLAFLDSNDASKVSLDAFAKEQHLSSNYLSHLIKKISGKSFRDILSYIRCCKSQQFLLDRDYKINELAYDMGFSQPAYYKKNFWNYFKKSPDAFRDAYAMASFADIQIETDYETLSSQIKGFAHKHGLALTLLSNAYYTIDYIDINQPATLFENLLSDMGRIRNIKTEMSEETHKTIDSMHKNFRMTTITIDAAASLKNVEDSIFLPIAKNINYLINCGFTVAFELRDTETPKNLINALAKFLLFYSRIYYDNITLIKILFKAVANSDKLDEQISMVSNKIYDIVGIRFDTFTSSDYIHVINYIPEIYDSFVLAPFAMDELLHPKRWSREIDFSLIDEVKSDGMVLRGGNGLLTWSGIKKPWWHAYMFVSKIRGNIIAQGDDHIVTNDNGRIAILTYNMCHKKPNFLEQITSREALENAISLNEYRREHNFQISGLKGRYKITNHALGKNACIFSKWKELGYTTYLTDEEESIIARICHPDVDFHVVDIYEKFNITITENTFGVSFTVLEKIY